MTKSIVAAAFWISMMAATVPAQSADFSNSVDDRHVAQFLEEMRSQWQDLNVPFEDGKFLRDFVVDSDLKIVIEVGTSTGHSALWLAWGLTKTDGHLVTFEIDEERHGIALRNFRKARLSNRIDARLENARTGVLTVKGPVDLVFLDGDREMYRHYFKSLAPRLSERGCFVTHNVENRFWDVDGYLEMVRGAAGFTTTIERPSTEAIAVTCRSAHS